jgi:hypothetical protein
LRAHNLLHAITIIVMPIALFASVGHAQTTSPTNCVFAAGSNIVTCATNNAATGTFAPNTFTLTGGTTGSGFSCSAVTPESQTVQLGAATQQISGTCAGATGYQWYRGSPSSGGTPVSGATNASFTPPSSQEGTSTYYLTGTKAGETKQSITGGTVTVLPRDGPCPAGEPRLVTPFSATLQKVDLDKGVFGPNPVFVARITISPTDSTAGRQLLPSFNFYYNDNSPPFQQRTVTLSQSCGDFSASATLLGVGEIGAFSFVTSDDPRTTGNSIRFPSAGVWYINMKNNDCAAGTSCSSFGAIWRASTF